MTLFAITYHFLDDPTADVRRASLLREIARCDRQWGGTAPGFTLAETDEPLALLEERLYLDSNLNAIKDRLLVIELAGPPAAAGRGALAEREGLYALLPGAVIA